MVPYFKIVPFQQVYHFLPETYCFFSSASNDLLQTFSFSFGWELIFPHKLNCIYYVA